MIYLDTSCLLKLLRDEPESGDLRDAVGSEEIVVVSSLTELEAEVQLKAAAVGGEIRTSQWRQYQRRLPRCAILIHTIFATCRPRVFSTALRQHRHPRAAFCRAMDRLHLAAMEELKLTRLMTLDEIEAKTASALDYEVVRPGRD